MKDSQTGTHSLPDINSSLELQRRLAGFGTTALIMGGILVGAQQAANANIVLDHLAAPVTVQPNGTPLLFDFNTGTASFGSNPGAGQFKLSANTYTYHLRFGTLVANGGAGADVEGVPGSGPIAAGFNAGQLINGVPMSHGLMFSRSIYRPYSPVGNFSPGTTDKYLGLEFAISSVQYFGWAEVSVDSNEDITLTHFAYNDTPGGSIQAGEFGTSVAPEANPLLLLLIGGPVALASYRSRRKDDEAALAG